ncbi:MAG: energy-coupling factor ABC transporter permease [Pseudomonadales bacterium]|nr:energy-coupling factor ABC transporter permease [Pseudomonadales bacterium]NRA15003.1 energy-coupling factor ABC transporter permease [Oceanospirillaceae bacterium]
MISLNTEGLSELSYYFFNALFLLVFIYACYRSPWHLIKTNSTLQHLCFGATVTLMLLWSIKADISTGISIHLIGMTVLSLVLGWDLAIVCASIALTLVTIASASGWANFAANGVITLLLPVAVTYIIAGIVDRKLPKNFFIYLFVCGFFCAGLSAVLVGLSVSATLWVNDIYPWVKIQREIVTIILLTVFPEGLLNGMLLTAIMVFYPDWIRSFDAKAYIDDQ